VTEDKIVVWHHRLKGHNFEQTMGDNERQRSLGALHCMGLQRVEHNLTTEEQQKPTLSQIKKQPHT